MKQRERVYDLWEVGEPYSNFIFSATHVEPRDLKFRTVRHHLGFAARDRAPAVCESRWRRRDDLGCWPVAASGL